MTDDPDVESPIAQSMMFTQLFHDLEECDSKRVDDFWDELDNSVLEIRNPKDMG